MKRLCRRALGLVLCALLALQLALPPVQAADRVYFTAVTNYILPLSDSTMPFWSGGYVYIASTIFTGTAREALNISHVLNNAKNQVVIYRGGRSLTFDWTTNFARDNDGVSYYPGAVRRNGVVFVPAYLIAQYFDLVYSVIEVDRGSLVWLRQSSYGASDQLYADAAKTSMESVYAAYIKAKEQPAEEPDPPSAPAPAPEPAQPSAPQPAAPGAEPEPEVNLRGRQLYLCLEADTSAALLLNALDAAGAQGAFFCGMDFLTRQGGLLRRMAATGHSIGLLADAADPERSLEQQLEAGNQALFQAACCKTRLVYIQNASAQDLQTARALGYACLRPELDRSGAELRTAAGAASLLHRAAGRPGDVTVWLGGSASAAGLRALLSAVEEAGGSCAPLTELSE